MEFNTKDFLKAKFKPGIEDVSVPALAAFFSGLKEKEVPVWKVRGLTGVEMGLCNEAAERNSKIGAILEGIVSDTQKETVKAVKGLLGVGGDIPHDIAARVQRLVLGSVAPKVDQELAVKICKVYPAQFYQLTNKILVLSGSGHVPGKPPGSGESPA